MVRTTDIRLEIPATVRRFLAGVIAKADGREVLFRARVSWREARGQPLAEISEVEVAARGGEDWVPALVSRAAGWHIVLHNHPSGSLELSAADAAVASLLGESGIGFAVISSDAERHYLSVPPVPPRQERSIDVDEVERVFSPGGLLEQSLDGFEPREGQRAFAVEIARALTGRRVVAAEAGTGVGKSFAYLVPAILWAVANRERVVISTGTIQLQEQLVRKDLPFLARVLPVEFTFALIKGRGNYACRRKLEELAGELAGPQQLDTIDARENDLTQLRSLVEWGKATSDGSRSDLDWTPRSEVWERIQSETDTSLRGHCEHHDTCFYYQARREAGGAAVLVVNHHLFFADLAVRRELGDTNTDAVIPAYARVIFDEAHHVEDVASEYLGLTFSTGGIRQRLARMCSPSDEQRGTARRLVAKLRVGGDAVAADAVQSALETPIREAIQRVDDDADALRAAFVRALAAADADGVDPVAVIGGSGFGGERKLRYRGDPRVAAFWSEVSGRAASLQAEIGKVLHASGRALEALQRARLPTARREALALDLTAFAGRLERMLESTQQFCRFDANDGLVRWVTARADRRRRGDPDAFLLGFSAAPIRVGGELKSHVYDAVDSVVLTSATLSVGGRIDFLADRLGLDQVEGDRQLFRSYASPFDFGRQALTLIPTDLALPQSPSFAAEVPGAVLEIVRATAGRAFVLFTSYRLLESSWRELEGPLRELGLMPLRQGDAPRSALLERFRASLHGVLFGTDSFWEGVDVQGDALQCVIITRLPFRVPTEPLQEARVEELESRGGHAFRGFALPQAVLKLKQGFGRLIRSTRDRGVVAILDRRVVTKPYGRVFLESLPGAERVEAPTAELARRAAAFLAGAPPAAASPAGRPPGAGNSRDRAERFR